MTLQTASVAIVGGGNMGGAIARGLVRSKQAPTASIAVVEPDEGRRAVFLDEGFAAVEGAADLAGMMDDETAFVLAVKPQMLPVVASAIGPMAGGRLAVSILAGATSAVVRTALTHAGANPPPRVIRTMPNTPALIGKGMTAIASGVDISEADLAKAQWIFAPLGETVVIEESLMDAFTAVVGSGPAYVFHLTEAMAAGAVAVGFEPALADRLARATVVGAGALLGAADATAAELRTRVTSKGGTTQAALESLASDEFPAIITRAIAAARDRGAHLARAAAGEQHH